MEYLLFVLGIAALVVGAEILVRGASAVAVRTGLSPVVVGLTVVAFGTSAPELAVSVGAAFRDEAELAIGNVVGSNIFNILGVLGLSAIVGGGLAVAQKIVRIDVPIMVGASLLLAVMSLDNRIGRIEGFALFAGIVAYTVWTVRASRNESSDVAAEYDEAVAAPSRHVALDMGMVVVGVGMLVLGADWMVGAASDIARGFGVSDLVIGLTVVAVGTSAPELATSVVAAARGERDIAVGNAVGSNLFNILSVLGLTGLIAPSGLPISDEAIRLDLPVMVAVAIACLPIFFNGYEVKRWEGGLFVVYYIAYVTFLVLDQTGSGLRDPFAVVMTVFVLPLTVLTLAIVGFRAYRAHQEPATA
jgi:cation:H+ antiporter